MSDLLLYINNHFLVFVLSISLLIFIFFASRINKKNKYILASIVLATIALAIFEFLETIFAGPKYTYENLPRYIFSVLAYILRPIIIVLFYHIRLELKNKFYFLIWIGVIVNAIIYSISLFAYHNPDMRLVVWYTENNTFDRTWLGLTVYFVCGLYLVTLMLVSIIESIIDKKISQINIIVMATSGFAIFMEAMVFAFNLQTSFTSEVFILGAALYFIYLNYDKATKDAINHEREIQANTTAIMLSQIQPHFIYNTLATIQVLCEIDPERASMTIENFSKYLRLNTDALSKREPVSVLDEVKHAKTYSEIEMVRFDQIKVLFEIEDKDFKLPVLTIEPLVENAIKYGVRAKESGTVLVKTYKDETTNNHILKIIDNGVGFDVNNIGNDGKNHVGLKNVKTRLENMVNASFEIESIIGEGTTITITVPEE